MGIALFESGAMKESRIPVCEKGNGPSSLRQIQHGAAENSFGMLSEGHTMESSSAVRLIEVKAAVVAQVGTGALGGWRTMA